MKDSPARLNQLKCAACIWYAAEYGGYATMPVMPPMSDIYPVAIPRVKAVFGGEVRWSEASPGDKAIWNMRPLDTKRWLDGVDDVEWRHHVSEPEQLWHLLTSP